MVVGHGGVAEDRHPFQDRGAEGNFVFYGILFLLIQGITKLDDEKVLGITHLRLVYMDNGADYAEQLYGTDEALEVLEYPDMRQMAGEKEDIASKKKEFHAYKEAYVAKSRSVRVAKAKASPHVAVALVPPVVRKVAFHGGVWEVAQHEATEFCPRGGHIWRATQKDQWHGHMKPYSRFHFKFGGDVTCQAAAVQTIRRLWQQYLLKEGLGAEDCPYSGLF